MVGRAIPCRPPSARRREEPRAIEKSLGPVAAATRRQKRRLEGEDRIGERVGTFKMAKRFERDIDDNGGFAHRRNAASSAAGAAARRFACHPHHALARPAESAAPSLAVAWRAPVTGCPAMKREKYFIKSNQYVGEISTLEVQFSMLSRLTLPG